ncbi:unnamed protein product [Lupinus luteus]|uniref:Uncharacterized protein n=1 Tax=Lupinus luteus TaxID=3873 RepID=A0AAV1VXS7_LUPLU
MRLQGLRPVQWYQLLHDMRMIDFSNSDYLIVDFIAPYNKFVYAFPTTLLARVIKEIIVAFKGDFVLELQQRFIEFNSIILTEAAVNASTQAMEKTGSAYASKRWAMLGAAGLIIPEAFNKYGANCGPEAVWFKRLYPGYIIFFVQSALMVAGSRVIYKWWQVWPPTIKNAFVLMNFAYMVLVTGYSSVGCMVLSLHETIASYGSIYYIGTTVQVVLILLGIVIKLGKPVRSKARKE